MFVVEHTNEQVVTLRHEGIAAGWQQSYLLMSDVHFDSPLCDRRLLKKHLEQVIERRAGVICVGDWFDAMGGKSDKRSSKSKVRDEDQQDNYLDCLVRNSVDYLAPYRDYLVMFGDGNHETAILKHLETDLLERMCRDLGCLHVGYSGFIRFMFQGSKHTTRRLYFHHGSGGGGVVTKGVIGANRKAASIDADIFVSGHIHEAWTLENMITTMTERGIIEHRTQLHIQLPTYKQEATGKGFHTERGRPAKPLGAYWLTFYHDNDAPGRVGYRVERAN